MNPVSPQSLANGEQQAFEALYELSGKRLYHYFLGQLKSEYDAEDLLQIVMARLAKYRKKFAKVKYLDCYVFAVARNELRRFLSSRKRRTAMEGADVDIRLIELPDDDKNPGDIESIHAELNAALNSLPAEQLEIVSLKTWQNLTFEQIAKVVGINANTAASRYRYAIEKLRNIMENSDEKAILRRDTKLVQAF